MQGIVSVRKDDKVVMKFIAGCNGNGAPALAKALRELGRVPDIIPVSLEPARWMEAARLATKAGFGCAECLVIQTSAVVYMDCSLVRDDAGLEDVLRLYREKFDDPVFNPRWKYGTADCLEIVDF